MDCNFSMKSDALLWTIFIPCWRYVFPSIRPNAKIRSNEHHFSWKCVVIESFHSLVNLQAQHIPPVDRLLCFYRNLIRLFGVNWTQCVYYCFINNSEWSKSSESNWIVGLSIGLQKSKLMPNSKSKAVDSCSDGQSKLLIRLKFHCVALRWCYSQKFEWELSVFLFINEILLIDDLKHLIHIYWEYFVVVTPSTVW